MVRRCVLLAICGVLLLGACGEAPTVLPTAAPAPTAVPTPGPAAEGLLAGIVLIGPMCPVVREDQPCPDQPYEADLVVQSPAGVEIARVRSGADGRFAIALPPGEYVLVPQPPAGARLPYPGEPQALSLLAGRTAVLTVTYDSGIR